MPRYGLACIKMWLLLLLRMIWHTAGSSSEQATDDPMQRDQAARTLSTARGWHNGRGTEPAISPLSSSRSEGAGISRQLAALSGCLKFKCPVGYTNKLVPENCSPSHCTISVCCQPVDMSKALSDFTSSLAVLAEGSDTMQGNGDKDMPKPLMEFASFLPPKVAQWDCPTWAHVYGPGIAGNGCRAHLILKSASCLSDPRCEDSFRRDPEFLRKRCPGTCRGKASRKEDMPKPLMEFADSLPPDVAQWDCPTWAHAYGVDIARAGCRADLILKSANCVSDPRCEDAFRRDPEFLRSRCPVTCKSQKDIFTPMPGTVEKDASGKQFDTMMHSLQGMLGKTGPDSLQKMFGNQTMTLDSKPSGKQLDAMMHSLQGMLAKTRQQSLRGKLGNPTPTSSKILDSEMHSLQQMLGKTRQEPIPGMLGSPTPASSKNFNALQALLGKPRPPKKRFALHGNNKLMVMLAVALSSGCVVAAAVFWTIYCCMRQRGRTKRVAIAGDVEVGTPLRDDGDFSDAELDEEQRNGRCSKLPCCCCCAKSARAPNTFSAPPIRLEPIATASQASGAPLQM